MIARLDSGSAWLLPTAILAQLGDDLFGCRPVHASGPRGAGTPWTVALLLYLLLNARHILYGPSLAPKIPAPAARLSVLSHGLTDEVFAVGYASLGVIVANLIGALLCYRRMP